MPHTRPRTATKKEHEEKGEKLKLEDWQSSETALVNHEIHIFKDIHLEDD